ncbi:hypothetical protein EGW08_002680, partial [Elysia chlorotica]
SSCHSAKFPVQQSKSTRATYFTDTSFLRRTFIEVAATQTKPRWGPTSTSRRSTGKSKVTSCASLSVCAVGSTDSCPPSTGPHGLPVLTRHVVWVTGLNKFTFS